MNKQPMIRISERLDCREIYVDGDRWGITYFNGIGWSVYKAEVVGTSEGHVCGFTFAGSLHQLGEETVRELVK